MIPPFFVGVSSPKKEMKNTILIDVAGLDRAYGLIMTELIRLLTIVGSNLKSFL